MEMRAFIVLVICRTQAQNSTTLKKYTKIKQNKCFEQMFIHLPKVRCIMSCLNIFLHARITVCVNVFWSTKMKCRTKRKKLNYHHYYCKSEHNCYVRKSDSKCMCDAVSSILFVLIYFKLLMEIPVIFNKIIS